jgi:glucose/arabinose dehydrogenase
MILKAARQSLLPRQERRESPMIMTRVHPTMRHRYSMATALCAFASALIVTTSIADAALLVASHQTHSVLQYDEQTGAFNSIFVATQSGGLDLPTGLAFGPDGNLYVGRGNAAHVFRYDGSSGAFIDLFADGSSLAAATNGITFGPDGDLYVSAGGVLRFDGLSGALGGYFVPPGAGGLDGPHGLIFGPDGHLYISSAENDQVLRYDGETGAALGVFASGGGLDLPVGLAFGPDGHLYVSSHFSDSILRYDALTGAFVNVFASGGGLDNPVGLAFGPDGHLYVVSSATDSVLRYDGSTGAFLGEFVTAQSGGLDSPSYLLFNTAVPEPSGFILFAVGLAIHPARRFWRTSKCRRSRGGERSIILLPSRRPF